MNSSAEMEEGEEEQRREEDEEFYESLDRILSSSCSSTSTSTSTSDDDGDHHHHHHHHRRQHNRHNHRAPSFPAAAVAASMYDVWISEPSSVEERRRRLLLQMGLIGDPSLSRRRSSHREDGDGGGAAAPPPSTAEMGRSASWEGLDRPQERRHPNYPSSAVVRSRSDGSVDHTPLTPPLAQPNKPRITKSPSSGANTNDSHEESDGRDDSIEERDRPDRYCTIKNLDNGEEFVVKEVSEDGMWNKLREVGTGRQFTMEEFQNSIIGHSPIVEELMRRQNVEESGGGSGGGGKRGNGVDPGVNGSRSKKRGGWLRSIRSVAGTVVQRVERRSSDERDTSSEKGGRRSSSATDDSQDTQIHHGPERVKVRQYGKSWKELSGLYMSQEIQAHNGSIWSIKFSLDGRYLASAGEDCVIHVWQVLESEGKGEMVTERGTVAVEDRNSNPFAAFSNGSPEPLALSSLDGNNLERKRRVKVAGARKSFSLDHVAVLENVFALSEKPVCSFRGHLDDVLDLSWSKSEYLLSSSMDKTVRLWHMSSNSCLKTFSHSDYVTCIQFNPVDDNYFISGSLDAKVRLWSIKQRQVVDWNDLHEMVTAACYTPDGQGALVGSHKGSCHLYDTSENRLQQKTQIDLQNKKKKSRHKKITGLQFAPGSTSEVLITSADSRIRLVDGLELVHKMKGFRNTSSQISASFTADGKYVICASEDSHVYVWRYDADSRPSRSKGVVTVTQSYEHFHCHDVSVATTWPGNSGGRLLPANSNKQDGQDADSQLSDEEANCQERSPSPAYEPASATQQQSFANANGIHFFDRFSATWPEEKLLATVNKQSPRRSGGFSSLAMQAQSRPAWGMVIVTAGRGGEIRTFQNFGCPVRI